MTIEGVGPEDEPFGADCLPLYVLEHADGKHRQPDPTCHLCKSKEVPKDGR